MMVWKLQLWSDNWKQNIQEIYYLYKQNVINDVKGFIDLKTEIREKFAEISLEKLEPVFTKVMTRPKPSWISWQHYLAQSGVITFFGGFFWHIAVDNKFRLYKFWKSTFISKGKTIRSVIWDYHFLKSSAIMKKSWFQLMQ